MGNDFSSIIKSLQNEKPGVRIEVPDRIMQRDLVKGTPSAGGYAVSTDSKGMLFSELSGKSVVLTAGGQLLSGLIGDVAIPKISTAPVMEWINENVVPASVTSPVFGSVSMTPKILAMKENVSRKLAKQSDPAMELVLTQAFSRTINQAIDKAAISGTGSDNQPQGILYNSSVPVTSGSLTYANILATIESAEGYEGQYSFVISPETAGLLRNTEGISGSGIPVLSDSSICGFPVHVTVNCPDDVVVFGSFSNLVIGTWETSLIIDPRSDDGSVSYTLLAGLDVAIIHPAAFSILNIT